jgi:hypothetical protein
VKVFSSIRPLPSLLATSVSIVLCHRLTSGIIAAENRILGVPFHYRRNPLNAVSLTVHSYASFHTAASSTTGAILILRIYYAVLVQSSKF